MSEEVDLWVAVITQALWDATCGVSGVSKNGRDKDKAYTIPNGNNGYGTRVMRDGRKFVNGECGGLAEVCGILKVSYPETLRLLQKRYWECMEEIPKKYQDTHRQNPHNVL